MIFNTDRSILHKDIETIDHTTLYESVEKPLLRRQLEYVFKNSSFYRQKYGKLGFSPKEAFEHFNDLPFTTKPELLIDQEENPPFGSILACNIEKLIRVHKTSGMTGRPLFLGFTRYDIDVILNSGSRCFWASGLRPQDIVIHCLNYQMWMGGYTDHQSLEAVNALVVPYGVGNTYELIKIIKYLKPTAIHCTPSYLTIIGEVLKSETKLKPIDLGLKKGLLAAEPGFQNMETRLKVEEEWGMKIFNANYGMADLLSMFGAECYMRNGLHFMGGGNILCELINPETLKKILIKTGCIGELLLTNLKREGQPLVRYRSHDIVKIISVEPCECGRHSFRFNVIGRSDDMLTIRGINVYPTAIAKCIEKHKILLSGEFRIIIDEEPPWQELKIEVETAKGIPINQSEKIISLLIAEIKKELNVTSKITILEYLTLPRFEGKTSRIFRTKKLK